MFEKNEFIYISNEAHYEQVIERIKSVKKTLWIGTADIKDLYVKEVRGTKPLLEVLRRSDWMRECANVHINNVLILLTNSNSFYNINII